MRKGWAKPHSIFFTDDLELKKFCRIYWKFEMARVTEWNTISFQKLKIVVIVIAFWQPWGHC